MGCEFELLLDTREQIVQYFRQNKDENENVVFQELQVSGPLLRIINGELKKAGSYVGFKTVVVDYEGNATATFSAQCTFEEGSDLPYNQPMCTSQMLFNRKGGAQQFTWPTTNPTEIIQIGQDSVTMPQIVCQQGGLNWMNQTGTANKFKDNTHMRKYTFNFPDRATVMNCIARNSNTPVTCPATD
jgi:hypothetical protein